MMKRVGKNEGSNREIFGVDICFYAGKPIDQLESQRRTQHLKHTLKHLPDANSSTKLAIESEQNNYLPWCPLYCA